MKYKIFDSHGSFLSIFDRDTLFLFSRMKADTDPRVSACLDCRSCVLATDPLVKLIDEISVEYSSGSELIPGLNDFLEETDAVHLYIWEENECLHRLWRDPLASEWSNITGEKRLR